MSTQKTFQNFIDMEYGKLVNYTNRILGSSPEADGEDVVQDVLLRIFENGDPTVPVSNLSAYIYRSLRNRVTDIFRKKKPDYSLDADLKKDRDFTLNDLLKDSRFAAHDPAEDKEWRELLFSALDELKDEERALVIAVEMEKKTYRELASSWDIPAGTLMARKKRALNKIKRFLLKHEPELKSTD